MAKDKLPPDHKRFEFKAGREGFQWGGSRSEGDPSSNPNNQPRALINQRWYGGGYLDRPGLAAFNATALHNASACITSLYDLNLSNPVKTWVVGDGCPGQSSSVGFYVGALDMEQDPEFQPYYYYSAATSSVAIGDFDSYIHILVDDKLYRSNLIVNPYGTSALPIGGTGTDTALATYTGFVGRWMHAQFGLLFVLLDGGAGASKIATWDGVTDRPTERTGLQIPRCATNYRIQDAGDALAVGYSTGNLVSLRSSAGTWTDIVPGAGTVTAFRMAAYKDVLWMTNNDENMFKLEGGTLTRVVPATTGIGAASVTKGLAVINGTLYVLYHTATNAVRIASFDGSSWSGNIKNLTTQFTGLLEARDLVAYRGHLIAAAQKGASGGMLYSALASGITGAWTEIVPDGSTNGDIDQLLVA